MKFFRSKEFVTLILALIAFGIGAMESPYFLDGHYLLDATSLYVETGLMVIGMTFVILAGEIDLSVASTLALVACITAKMAAAGVGVAVVVPAGLALGTLLGWFNGVLVAKMGLPSFVVTLGTMAAFRGASQAMLGPNSVKVPQNLVGVDYVTLPGTPVPLPLCFLIVFVALFGFVLHRTVFGRWVLAVGTNRSASYYSGVPAHQVKTAVFAISGFLAAAAGLVMNSRLGVARFDDGRGLELDVITVVVLGGASIYGGSGSMLGSMLALALIALLKIGMGLANVTAEYQLAAIGILLIAAILAGNLADGLSGVRKKSKGRPTSSQSTTFEPSP